MRQRNEPVRSRVCNLRSTGSTAISQPNCLLETLAQLNYCVSVTTERSTDVGDDVATSKHRSCLNSLILIRLGMFRDKRCEIKCVFPYVVGIRIMCIHISCDMFLCLGLHVQTRLYYVLPYKLKISAQHGIDIILDRCIVYLGLTMPNLQKQRLLIFEIFNIQRSTLLLGTEYTFSLFPNFIFTQHSKKHEAGGECVISLFLETRVYFQ